MKKQKGMTLVEIVVSLGIYALLGLLLMEIMSVVNTTMRSTNQLNDRLSFEAKFADNQMITQANRDGSGAINISYGATNFTNPTGTINNNAQYNGYVCRYTNPKLTGTIDYSADVNFRFMTFSQTIDDADFQGFSFNMQLMVVPFLFRDNLTQAQMDTAQTNAETFMSHISRVEVTAEDTAGNTHLIDGAAMDPDPANQTAPIFLTQHTRVLANNQTVLQGLVNMRDQINGGYSRMGTTTLPFEIENLTELNETRVQVSNDPSRTEESNGNGYTVVVNFIDETVTDPSTSQPLVRLSVEIPRVYMYVRRGSTESRYNSSMVVVDLNMVNAATQADRDRAIIVCRSNNTGIFDLTEYDVP